MSLADDLPPRASFWLLGILPLAALVALFAYVVAHARNFRTSTLMAFTGPDSLAASEISWTGCFSTGMSPTL